jgi:hypothetical protein
MIRGNGLLLLSVLAVGSVSARAQDRESRPIDSGTAVAGGNSPTAQTIDSCDPEKKRALVLSGGGLKGAF